MQVRRVVTGHKKDGKATVLIDELSRMSSIRARGAPSSISGLTPLPVDSNDDSDGAPRLSAPR